MGKLRGGVEIKLIKGDMEVIVFQITREKEYVFMNISPSLRGSFFKIINIVLVNECDGDPLL